MKLISVIPVLALLLSSALSRAGDKKMEIDEAAYDRLVLTCNNCCIFNMDNYYC